MAHDLAERVAAMSPAELVDLLELVVQRLKARPVPKTAGRLAELAGLEPRSGKALTR